MSKGDGGLAFPVLSDNYFFTGMSLRDWFAGHALVGLMAGRPDAECGPKGYANDAYRLADAMLEARKGGEE